MLGKKYDALTEEIEKYSKDSEEPQSEKDGSQLIVPPEFERLFDEFPTLKSALSQNYTSDVSIFEDKSDNNSPEKDSKSFPKRRKKQLPHNIPEYEWVLRTQGKMEHQMFDDDVADLIDTDILSSPSKRRRIANSTATQNLEEKAQLENIYRMFGISAFPVVDPGDLALNNGQTEAVDKMLGIRIEIFNETTRNFESPHYLILKRNPKNESWELFKHTVPTYLNVEHIFDSTNPGGFIVNDTDVYIFATKVYRKLLQVFQRVSFFKELEKAGRIKDLEADLCANAVSFKTLGGIKVLLRMRGGEIIACAINQINRKWEAALLGPMKTLIGKLEDMNEEVA